MPTPAALTCLALAGLLAGGGSSGSAQLDPPPTPDPGWPSLDAWSAYFELETEFRGAIEHELRTPAGDRAPLLVAHAERCRNALLDPLVDVEVALISAYDFERARWIEDGWQLADEEAWSVLGALERAQPGTERDRLWEHVIDVHSGFWDPPKPTRGFGCSMYGERGDGRFGRRTHDALRALLWETSYSDFLKGGSIADLILEELAPGALAGPYPTAFGPCLVRLHERAPQGLRVHPLEARGWSRIEADYVRRRFLRYAHEALAAAEVVGLPAAAPPARVIPSGAPAQEQRDPEAGARKPRHRQEGE